MNDVMKQILKDNGLEIAEETAITAVKAVLKSLPAIALATENKVDDLFVPVIGLLEPKIIELLDQINKADNE